MKKLMERQIAYRIEPDIASVLMAFVCPSNVFTNLSVLVLHIYVTIKYNSALNKKYKKDNLMFLSKEAEAR
jgi:hypothetical protein